MRGGRAPGGYRGVGVSPPPPSPATPQGFSPLPRLRLRLRPRAAKATQPLSAGPDVGLSTLSTPVSRCAQPPPEVSRPLTFSVESSLIGERLVHPNIFCLVAFFYFFFFSGLKNLLQSM